MNPSSRLPRPLIAGIGFASTIPGLLAELPAKLPAAAITSAIEARARYLEYLRAGEALLAGDGESDESDEFADYDDDLEDLADVEDLDDVDDEDDDDTEDLNGATATPTELPIEGFDELSTTAIRNRLSRLDTVDVQALLTHEKEHGKRPAVLAMLENRLAKLAEDEG